MANNILCMPTTYGIKINIIDKFYFYAMYIDEAKINMMLDC